MKLIDVVRAIEGEVIAGEELLDHEVFDVGASDLLSDILTLEKDNYILFTGLTNAQVLRTAEITNACCVVVVRGKQPQAAMVSLARNTGIPLILSPLSLFDCCARASRLMEQG